MPIRRYELKITTLFLARVFVFDERSRITKTMTQKQKSPPFREGSFYFENRIN